MTEGIPLNYFLVLATIMFFIGIYGFLTRKNLITILMSIELILNSVNINFVAFNKYLYPDRLQGHFYALFIIAVAAAEAERLGLPTEKPSSLSMLKKLKK